MFFRFPDALISLRLNYYPMAAALDRMQRNVSRHAKQISAIKINLDTSGVAAWSRSVDKAIAKASDRLAKSAFGKKSINPAFVKRERQLWRRVRHKVAPKIERFGKKIERRANLGIYTRQSFHALKRAKKKIRSNYRSTRASMKRGWRDFKRGSTFGRRVGTVARIFHQGAFGTRATGANVFGQPGLFNFHRQLDHYMNMSRMWRPWRMMTSPFRAVGAAAKRYKYWAAANPDAGIHTAAKTYNSVMGGLGTVIKGAGAGLKEFTRFAIKNVPISRAIGSTWRTATAVIGGFGSVAMRVLNPVQNITRVFRLLANVGVGIFNGFSTAFTAVRKFVAITSVGLAAGVMLSVKAAGDMEAALVNIARIAGIASGSIDYLKGRLLGIASASSGVSLQEINQLAEFGARLGVGGGWGASGIDKLAVFTEDLARLKLAIDDIPVEEAATKIVRILNVFGEGIDKVNNFSSALVRLDNASTATGKDILELTRRMAGASATIGISVQETMALATAMRDVGIEPEVGGTSIQNFFVRLASDTKNFAKQLKLSESNLRNLFDTKPMEAMRVVLRELSKRSPREQANLFTKLHLQGQRMTSTIWQLVKGFDKFDTMLGLANSEWQTTAAIEDAVTQKSGTLWAMLQRLWNQTNVLAVEFGTRLLPAFKELAALLSAVTIAMTATVNANGTLIDSFVAKVGKLFKSLRILVEDPVFAMKYLKAQFTEQLYSLAESIGRIFESIANGFMPMAENIGTILSNAFSWLRHTLLPVVVDLGTVLGEAMMAAMSNAMDIGFHATIERLQEALAKVGDMGIPGLDVFTAQAKRAVQQREAEKQQKRADLDKAQILGMSTMVGAGRVSTILSGYESVMAPAKTDAQKRLDASFMKLTGMTFSDLMKGTKGTGSFIDPAERDKAKKASEEADAEMQKRIAASKNPLADTKRINVTRITPLEEAMKAVGGLSFRGKKGLGAMKKLEKLSEKEIWDMDTLSNRYDFKQRGRKTLYELSGYDPSAKNSKEKEQKRKKFLYYSKNFHIDATPEEVTGRKTMNSLYTSTDASKLIGKAIQSEAKTPLLGGVGSVLGLIAGTEKTFDMLKNAVPSKKGRPVMGELGYGKDYKPEFFDLVEFNKKIQSDLFKAQQSDPMENVSKDVTALRSELKTRSEADYKLYETTADATKTLKQMAKDGQLIGPSYAV